MPTMGNYCKAYPIQRFEEFAGWSVNNQHLRTEKQQMDGVETEVPRELGETDHLFLQENYTVTDGIFLDENIVFDQVTPEWIAFCEQTLQFEIPVYEPIEIAEEEEAAPIEATATEPPATETEATQASA